jgi:exopolysaccharide production protein ExoQ
MRQLLSWAEKAFIVLSLILYTGGVLVVILSDGLSEGGNENSAPAPDYLIIKIIFQLTYTVALLRLVPHWEKVIYLLMKDRLILLLLVVILFSAGWSSAPELTLTRTIPLIGTSLFGLYFCVCYSAKQQLNLLGWAFGLVLILSLLFVIALPQYGIMAGYHAGAWRGVYSHKNVLGGMMAISSMTFLLLAMGASRKRWLFGLGLATSIFLLVMSRSSTPSISLAFTLIVFFAVLHLQGKSTLRVLAISISLPVVLGIGVAAALQAEAVVSFIGKDLTLTGRTYLWVGAWDLILRRPWLGYGYNALWNDWDSESAVVWQAVGWAAPGTHNGFLELFLGLGLLGVLIFGWHFLTHLFYNFAIARRPLAPEYYLPLLILLFTLFSNITEAPLLSRNTLYWVLYVSCTLGSQLTIEPKTTTSHAVEWP